MRPFFQDHFNVLITVIHFNYLSIDKQRLEFSHHEGKSNCYKVHYGYDALSIEV